MTTPVKYIGRKPSYTDYVHGSKLTFEPGQVRAIPDDSLARKFLRQVDIFERGDQDQEQAPATTTTEPPKDDTLTQLETVQKEKDKANELDNQRNALRAWAVTAGHEVVDRPFESWKSGVDGAFEGDGKFDIYWAVKQ